MIHDISSKIHHDLYPPPEEIDSSYPFAHLEHRSYIYNNAYKHRRASIAGYWAETYIFGGPVLFARGANGDEVCKFGLTLSRLFSDPQLSCEAPELTDF
jgi:hypothetical protein